MSSLVIQLTSSEIDFKEVKYDDEGSEESEPEYYVADQNLNMSGDLGNRPSVNI